MNNLIISAEIELKLSKKHSVRRIDVEQCFMNRDRGFLEDTRTAHLTDPITQWFIAKTDKGATLKIVFIFRDGNFYLRSAFKPNKTEIGIYNRWSTAC